MRGRRALRTDDTPDQRINAAAGHRTAAREQLRADRYAALAGERNGWAAEDLYPML